MKEYDVGESVTRILNRIRKDDILYSTMIPKHNNYFGTSCRQCGTSHLQFVATELMW